MKVLHLANDYSGSTVYKNLSEWLDRQGVEQTVYVALRSSNLVGKNIANFSHPNSKILYRPILNFYTRVNFYKKRKTLLKDVIQSLNAFDLDVIHAHTWFSDGSIAYELSKIYNIPYIVTVRNTDINLFYKYFIHLRKYGEEILINAKQIIFISPIYYRRFLLVPQLKSISKIRNKCDVIPNGVDDFWIENVSTRKTEKSSVIKLIFVGRFMKIKNLPRVIRSVKMLNKKGFSCQLSLVGGGGDQHHKVEKLIEGDVAFSFVGPIKDRYQLKQIYRDHDIFIMPSHPETFGLVYIEALSQGIPIIYSKNEGIDGLYDEDVGEAVQYLDTKDIMNAIIKISSNYERYSFDPQFIAQNHRWDRIAIKYTNIYERVKL